MKNTCTNIDQFMAGLRKRNPGQEEFHEAVQEVASDVLPFIANHKDYQGECLPERLTEPDRIISFRVSWVDDEGNVRANRAWRLQVWQGWTRTRGLVWWGGAGQRLCTSITKDLAHQGRRHPRHPNCHPHQPSLFPSAVSSRPAS